MKAIAVTRQTTRRGHRPARSRTCSSSWPTTPAPACPARSSGCACCTRRSSSGRRRARPSAACCRAAWPRSCGPRARKIGETERVQVTVLMADIRGYSGIAETADPSELAQQLNTHRAEMNHAILDEGGTVMQFVGDAVMAVFGAPFPQADHAERALKAARSMHRAPGRGQRQVGGRGPAAVRARHRPVDRRGGGRPARQRGAPRVHDRRRHREPRRPAAAVGRGGRDRPQRADVQGRRRRPARASSSSRPR